MSDSIPERLLDNKVIPTEETIKAFVGPSSYNRLNKIDSFLQNTYDISKELKFPFGSSYGWGYKYSCHGKLLLYIFFENGRLTATITIGKGEVNKLTASLSSMLPKTALLWENRYPCGDGGWIHYPVENDIELEDIKKLILLKKKPSKQHQPTNEPGN